MKKIILKIAVLLFDLNYIVKSKLISINELYGYDIRPDKPTPNRRRHHIISDNFTLYTLS